MTYDLGHQQGKKVAAPAAERLRILPRCTESKHMAFPLRP
jgi:hypothetical protein